MPHTRRDIIIGKLLGVVIPLAIAIVGCSLVAAGLATATYGIPSLGRLLAFILVSITYAFMSGGVGIAISSVTTSSVRVTGTMLVSAVVLLFWKPLITTFYVKLSGTPVNPFDPPADGILFLVRRLDPRSAYLLLTNWVYEVGNAADTYQATVAELNSGTGTEVMTNVFVVERTFERTPFYLAEPIGIVVLCGWLFVPTYLAVRAIREADL